MKTGHLLAQIRLGMWPCAVRACHGPHEVRCPASIGRRLAANLIAKFPGLGSSGDMSAVQYCVHDN